VDELYDLISRPGRAAQSNGAGAGKSVARRPSRRLTKVKARK
jgi:hypothetical protein